MKTKKAIGIVSFFAVLILLCSCTVSAGIFLPSFLEEEKNIEIINGNTKYVIKYYNDGSAKVYEYRYYPAVFVGQNGEWVLIKCTRISSGFPDITKTDFLKSSLLTIARR